MESQSVDIIETTLNIDAQRKVLLGWSNVPSIIKQWRIAFPSYCKIASDSSYAELNGVPLSEIKTIKVVPKMMLSNEEREQRRLRGIELAKNRAKTQ